MKLSVQLLPVSVCLRALGGNSFGNLPLESVACRRDALLDERLLLDAEHPDLRLSGLRGIAPGHLDRRLRPLLGGGLVSGELIAQRLLSLRQLGVEPFVESCTERRTDRAAAERTMVGLSPCAMRVLPLRMRDGPGVDRLGGVHIRSPTVLVECKVASNSLVLLTGNIAQIKQNSTITGNGTSGVDTDPRTVACGAGLARVAPKRSRREGYGLAANGRCVRAR